MYQPLLNELSRFADGISTVRDVETWLVSELQTILDSGDDGAIALANEVDSILIEFGEGLLPNVDALARVQALVRAAETTFRALVVDAQPVSIEDRSGSSAETIAGNLHDLPITNVKLEATFA